MASLSSSFVRLLALSLLATAFDIGSTIIGIWTLGWGVGFNESNQVIRALWPSLGLFAPLAYWPLEALLVTFGGLVMWKWVTTTRWLIKMIRPGFGRLVKPIGFSIAYFALLAPLFAAAWNLLTVFVLPHL